MSGGRDSRELVSLVRERIERWWAGGEPDAAALLDEHPELRRSKSMLLDLVQAEYSIRAAAGENVSKSQFCDQFPAYRQSIRRLLDVEDYLLDKCPPEDFADDRIRWPAPGDEFLGFEIVEPLGIGAWARVFLARERAVGNRLVVIKISPDVTREAHTLGKLSHPSIVQILHTVRDEIEGWTVICMPLVGMATAVDLLDAAFAGSARRDGALANGALVERVARETVPLTELPGSSAANEQYHWNLTYSEAIARLGLQLAEALQSAHAAGVLHRDIKPSNVLLAWSGRAMLLDFNLSAEAGAGSERPAGTLAYMAPEVIASMLGAARRADGSCDIYSLGAVLYELLTGRLPHRPDDVETLPLNAYEPWLECKRRRLVTEEMAGGHLTEMDDRLAAIVLKCLEFDPAARYESAAALTAELQRYLSKSARLGRFVRRRRREVVLGGLALVCLGTALGAYLGNRPTALEFAYRSGLEQYEAGEFEQAVASFTKCLELQSGWPQALFGRAQALRRLSKWREARTDYTALSNLNDQWSFAFAGYCNMQIADFNAAASDFYWAHKLGLRDIGFLMNYARTQSRQQKHYEAIKHYSEVIAIEPQHRAAIRNRALAHFFAVVNDKRLPAQGAFEDAREYCRLEPDSFEAPYTAAMVFGEAAKKDPAYEDQAIRYLTDAIKKGMPADRLASLPIQHKRLVAFVDADVLMNAQPRADGYRFDPAPIQEPPYTADWNVFLRGKGALPLLVRNP